MKKFSPLLPMTAAVLLLSGCVGALVEGGAVAGGMYATKPSEPPPADTASQIAPHENWCYRTMGEEVECFSEPQDTSPDRLVNVDPQNRYPLTARAYTEVVAQNRLANAPKEAVKDIPDPAALPALPVQPAQVTLPPQAAPQATPAPSKPMKKKHKKKHKKMNKPSSAPSSSSPPPAATPPSPPPAPTISN